MRAVYRIGLVTGTGGLLLLCLWGVLSRTDSVEKEALDFDVAPSVERLLFSTKSESHKGDRLFAFEKRTKLSRELREVSGSIEEICFLNEKTAVVTIRKRPRSLRSDVHAYVVSLENGSMQRLTKAQRVWEQKIIKVSSTQFIFSQYQVKTRLTPFGLDIYGLRTGVFLVDVRRGNLTPLQLDSAYYQIEQVVDNKRVVLLSFSMGDSKRWFLAKLDKPIDQPGFRILHRYELPVISNNLIVSNDGRFAYYVVQNAATGFYEIYRMEIANQQTQQLASTKRPITRLRWAKGQLFFLTDSVRPIIWQVSDDGNNLQRVVDVHAFR